MRIPTTLKHKPVFVCEDYPAIDARRSSDAMGISLGLAQWNDRGKVDVSVKVWRHTGEKWSRQSEELPLYRVLDMAIMICKTKEYLAEAYRIPGLYDSENPLVERIGLQGEAAALEVCLDNPMIQEDIRLFEEAMRKDDELLSERLHVLADALRQAGYGRQR